jgi:hypothetical protein
MAVIPVDTWYLGAGDIYLDDIRVGSTTGSAVGRTLGDLRAPTINGQSAPLARTDYWVSGPTPQMEFTFIEWSAASFGLIIPGAVVATDGDDVVITPPVLRRMVASAYHKWEHRSPLTPGGQQFRFTIYQGINTNPAEYTAEDSENPYGVRMMITGRVDPDDDTLPTFRYRLVAAVAS